MMQGTRLPDVRRDEPGGWEAFERCGQVVAPPGSYMKVLHEDGGVWCWYVRAPNGDSASLGFENHTVDECPDGTITVSPSIVFPHGGHYHGFLQAGVWT